MGAVPSLGAERASDRAYALLGRGWHRQTGCSNPLALTTDIAAKLLHFSAMGEVIIIVRGFRPL